MKLVDESGNSELNNSEPTCDEAFVHSTVKRFLAGDREAFGLLVARYQNLVTTVALVESGDYHRSEDIAQQSFLLAWQKQKELRDPACFPAWLRSIARNLARNERRLKANVQSRSDRSLDAVRPPEHAVMTPAEAHQNQEQKELLWQTLESIPPKYREPMILYYREEKSVQAVARQLDLSESAVKQRLSRGRAMLKQEISSMVEDLLLDSRPSPSFVPAVLATLPVAQVATKSSGTWGFKTMVAKVFGVVGAGALSGIIGGLLGVFGGIVGAWAGTKRSIERATSEEEKTTYRQCFAMNTTLAIVYFIALVSNGQSLSRAVWITVGFCCALAASTFWTVRRVRVLRKKYGHTLNS